MANRRFIDFPIATTVGNSDIILIWQSGVNKQTTKATFLSGLPENLDELNDVAISGLTNGQILRYDSVTGKWENTDQGNLDLNDLNDVSIVSPSNGQVLVYNSSTSKWENSSGGFVPYVGAVTTVDLGAQGLRAGYVRFDTSVASVPNEQGLMYWDASRSTAALIMNGTLQHIGQDTFFYVKNSSGSTIPKGTCVGFAGTDGASGHLLVTPFLANGSVPSTYFMGVTAEAITNGSFGQVMHFGELEGINTSSFTAGALLYASTTVAGGFQTTVPVAPNNIVLVAAAVNSKNNGAIVVRPTYGSNINIDEGVKITSPTTGDLLQLQAGGLWENKTLAQVIGSAYVPSTRTLTINGTAFDLSANRSWTVGDVRTDGSYSNPSWITALAWSKITGTPTTLSGYGITDAVPSSRTITINGVTQDLSANRSFNVGTVTSVGLSSATSGVTIGGSPVTGVGAFTLTIATASGSQQGLLSASDWTTFNNKQNALTNPVTGTGTTNYLAKFTGSTTIGNSQIFDNGTNVGIGTASVSGTYEKLAVAGGISIKDNTNAKLEIGRYNTTGAQNSYIKLGANSNSLRFTNNTDITDIMELTNSGNLGLGVTPSAWGGINGRIFELGYSGGSAAFFQNGADDFWTASNAYFNAGWKYTKNGTATAKLMSTGGHYWYTAPSGTAGNAISFTQAMTLTAGGNLLVGTTTDNGARLQVSGKLTVTHSSTDFVTEIINTASTNPYGLRVKDASGAANNYPLFSVSNNAGSVEYFRVNSGTGAATFSSSVTAGGSITSSTANYPQLIFQETTTSTNSLIFYDNVGSPKSLRFRVNGATNLMSINENGNVLIGTTSDNGARLQVSGAATFSENLGIGGNTSTNRLQVLASNTGTQITTIPVAKYINTGNSFSKFIIGSDNANYDAVISMDNNATLANTKLRFYIGNGVSSTAGHSNDQIVLQGNGNVGIGTASPGLRLHVSTTAAEVLRLQGTSGGSTNNTQLRFFGSNANTDLWAIGSEVATGSTDRAFDFYDLVAGANRMRITSSGNVLIGTTTNGSSKLKINGLPTSSAGLASGDVWNDGGTLKIA